MDRATELARREGVVDQPVLLDPALALERRRPDDRLEVDVVGRGDLGDRTRDGGLDALLELVGRGHLQASIEAAAGTAIFREAMQYAAITFTELGARKVQDFLDRQTTDTSSAGLRLGVRGGGCSGFQYQLAFDEQRDGDHVYEHEGLKVFVDDQSLPYVHGSQIDYIDQLTGAGFQVNNPNVVAACGCGSSFRVPDEEEVSAV